VLGGHLPCEKQGPQLRGNLLQQGDGDPLVVSLLSFQRYLLAPEVSSSSGLLPCTGDVLNGWASPAAEALGSGGGRLCQYSSC
jgi:hypothetical protein